MIKKVLKIFLIIYLFFVSLNTDAVAVNLNTDLFNNLNSIQSVNHNGNTIYNEVSEYGKFIVPASSTESIVLSKKQNDSSSSFGGYKDLLVPENHQFSLLLSYLYNKSYLDLSKNLNNKRFLTELSPNAP